MLFDSGGLNGSIFVGNFHVLEEHDQKAMLTDTFHPGDVSREEIGFIVQSIITCARVDFCYEDTPSACFQGFL